MQAKLLIPLLQQLLQKEQISINQCDAIAVSAGPGSYTGLRVGVSSAKGLCFGCDKPLIAINSLQVMAQNCMDTLQAEHPTFASPSSTSLAPETIIIPLMDARRMEVYTAQYTLTGEEILPTEAKIIDAESFREELVSKKVFFTGDGVEKCRSLLEHPNARFIPLMPSAEGMRCAAHRAYQEKKFVDLAYFEPNYLKNFVAGISRKSF